MTSTLDNDLLPVLVADLASDVARDHLERVAKVGGTVSIPLVTAPVDAGVHSLEIYTPGFPHPLRLFARPAGPPGPEGFPLVLTPATDEDELEEIEEVEEVDEIDRLAEVTRRASLEPRRRSVHTLTERHSRSLDRVGRPSFEPSDLVGRIIGGKLAVESFIGAGGTGAVFKALHRGLQMPVAIKVLHEAFQLDVDFCRRFHAEALAASRLDHPNLTRVLDFGQEPDGILYLAMEFLDGTELRKVLDAEKRLPLRRTVAIISQVCAALAHAHARDVIHRDIKPENLVLVSSIDDDGRPFQLVKLCDFGIAQVASSEASGGLSGTPEYMSPEQCSGETLGPASDVYACGVVLYELATGTLPFSEGGIAKIVNGHLHLPPEPPSRRAEDVDPRLERIIMKALDKDPAKRQADARQLRSELRALTHSEKDIPRVASPVIGEVVHRIAIPSAPRPKPPPDVEQRASDRRVEVVAGPPEEEWLERSGSWLDPSGSWNVAPVSTGSEGTDVSQALLREPARFLSQVASTTDPRAFRTLVAPIDSALRVLAQRGHADLLWRITSTLDILSTEGPQTMGSRAQLAASLLRIASDPQVLGPIAQRALLCADATDLVARLVVRAGLGGAHALYTARVNEGSEAARARFVELLREIGAPTVPVVRAALEHLEPQLAAGTRGALVDLVEDLLSALPDSNDDATGAIVVKYCRLAEGRIARRATAALRRLWGDRARAVFVALLAHPDEGVKFAALQSLRELHAIDEHVVRKLEPMIDGRIEGGLARRDAIISVARAEGEVRAIAADTLIRAFTVLVRERADRELIVFVGRAILVAGGESGRAFLNTKTARWLPDARAQFEKMLRSTDDFE